MKDIFSNIEEQIENIDEKLEGIIKNAIDSKNYEKLNQKITNMADNSINIFKSGYEKAEKIVKEQPKKWETSFDVQQEKIKKSTEVFKKKPKKEIFAQKDGVYAGGMAMAIIGFILAILLGIAFLVILSVSALLSFEFLLNIGRFVVMPLFVVVLLVGIIGILMIAKVKRFKKYIQILSNEIQADVNDFAKSLNKSVDFIRRDLKKMIAARWFKQGYLTHDEKTLIVCKIAYEEYKNDHQRTLEMQNKKIKIQQIHEQLPVQARAVIQKGEDVIKEIHEKKVIISECDMTNKLSHLESILKKIFKRVEKHPEVVPLMRKMMDYYLPTTVKLLEAYVQLKQAVQEGNILVAKIEIEDSLDTLILAYEKLLEDLFKDVMLDVSTDITVLNTMLAQDGLTADNFENISKRGTE